MLPTDLALCVPQVFSRCLQHVLQPPVLNSLGGVVNNLGVVELDALRGEGFVVEWWGLVHNRTVA